MTTTQNAAASTAPTGTLERERLEPVSPTVADRLRALEARVGARGERFKRNGQIYFALITPEEDRISGHGATNDEAIAHLEQRVAQLALEG